MRQTLLQPKQQTNSYQNDVVIQITKQQLIKFLQVLAVFFMAALNLLAIIKESPFLKELIVSQTILIFIFFIKNSKSNTIIK